jgi:hypothetical protein
MGLSPRTGFLERIGICAPIYVFPAATMLLVILSLNPRLAPAISPQLFRLPWTVFAALSFAACLGVVGYHGVRTGFGRSWASPIGWPKTGASSQEALAKIPALDPAHDFADLLSLADPYKHRTVREAATVRLRKNPNLLEALIAALNSRNSSAALAFVYGFTFSPDELTRLARPTRQAIERFTAEIPAPNYMPAERGGLTQALLEVESFHPPEITTALLRGLMERDGGAACHFAAMLYFLHGKSASAFDWNHRPFFLRFNTPDLEQREIAVRELCATLGADPSRYIRPRPATPVTTSKQTKPGDRKGPEL